jgi:hypothetical protein
MAMEDAMRSDTRGLLDRRQETHGDFANVAACAQDLKDMFRSWEGWKRLSPLMREALDADAVKTARVFCGDPTHLDHWRDKAGYAELVVESLESQAKWREMGRRAAMTAEQRAAEDKETSTLTGAPPRTPPRARGGEAVGAPARTRKRGGR